MTYFYTANLWIHIGFAMAALVLFWVPVFTKKGHLNHKKFGHYYKTAMYTVAATGVVMSLMVIISPLAVKPEYANHEDPEWLIGMLRSFSLFLIYLALLTFVSTRQGLAALYAKDDRTQLRKFHHLAPIWLLVIGGIALFTNGLHQQQTLHIAFGILGVVLGSSMLRYCLRANIAHRQWILEHIGNMIGSGIAAYTAFLTFGGRTLFSDLGQWQLLFWIAPGVIGGIASYLVCKHYAVKLGIANKQAQTA